MVTVALVLFLITVFTIQIVFLFKQITDRKKLSFVIKKKQEQLHYLADLTQTAVNDDNKIDVIFPKLLNELVERIGFNYHSIFRLNEEHQNLSIRFTGHFPDWYMEEFSKKIIVKVGDACIGRAVATRQPAIINVANNDPRFRGVSSIAGQTGYKSLSCYPMLTKVKTLGGMCAYSAYENIFTSRDAQFFSTCTNLFAALMEDRLIQNYITLKAQTTNS